MIYDYLKDQKTKPKIWYKTNTTKDTRNHVFQYAVENMEGFNYDLLHRYALVEKLSIHPQTYEIGEWFLLKLFSPTQKHLYIIKL